MGELAIRPMGDDDVPAVLELMRLALGETATLQRTPELFSWKHLDNPFGRSLLLVAESDEQIVGLRAFMRWELEGRDGNRLRCLRPVDTATHPSYRRRGIFQSLTEEAVAEARRQGVDLIFNTPNPTSRAGYLKMGWEEVGPIGVMVRPKLTLRWLRRASEVPPASVAIPGADPVDAGALPEARPHRGLRTPRTRDFLRWRFTAHPTVDYVAERVGNAAVVAHPGLRNGRTEVVVSEVIGEASSAPLRRLISSARCAYVAGWFSPGSPERRAAAGAGMVGVPGITALTLVARPLVDVARDVTNLDRWDLALSDLELL